MVDCINLLVFSRLSWNTSDALPGVDPSDWIQLYFEVVGVWVQTFVSPLVAWDEEYSSPVVDEIADVKVSLEMQCI